MNPETKEFVVDIIGKQTGTRYEGVFVTKMVLTRKEKFKVDETRRKYLGINGKDALPEVIIEAFILADLGARVVSAPEWWRITGNGEEIKDDNVLQDIYSLYAEVEKEFQKEREEELRDLVAEAKKEDVQQLP